MCQLVTCWEIRVSAPSKPIPGLSLPFFLHLLLPFLSQRLGDKRKITVLRSSTRGHAAASPFLDHSTPGAWSILNEPSWEFHPSAPGQAGFYFWVISTTQFLGDDYPSAVQALSPHHDCSMEMSPPCSAPPASSAIPEGQAGLTDGC